MIFTSENLLRFTRSSGYHSRVSQEVSCSVGLTGSSSLFRRGPSRAWDRFRKAAYHGLHRRGPDFAGFCSGQERGKATTRPLSIAWLSKSKKPVFFRESGKACVPVLHLQEGGKSVGPLGGSNSQAPFRGRSRAMSTPQSRHPLEGNSNREEEPVNDRKGPALSFIFLGIRRISYNSTH